MIDFENAAFFKLASIDPTEALSLVEPMLVPDEAIFAAFKTVRDRVIFTNKRVIAVNVEGITGKKKDFTSLAYSKIQAWSVATAGAFFDNDTNMDLWFAGLGHVTFEFKARFDITAFNRLIGAYIL